MSKFIQYDGIEGMSCKLFYAVPNRFCLLPKNRGYGILSSSYIEKVMWVNTGKYSGINKDSVLHELLNKYAAIDRILETATQEQKVQYICAQGCNDCCSEYFYISMLEYFLIKYTLINQGVFDEIRERGKKQYLQLQHDANSEYRKLKDQNTNLKLIYEDHEHIKRFLLCPLNDDTGNCATYEVRPVICRLYGRTKDFLPCEVIRKACKYPLLNRLNSKKLHKHILNIQFSSEWLEENNATIRFAEQTIAQRPYPLIYWLTHDANYAMQYASATTATKEDFVRIALVHHALGI